MTLLRPPSRLESGHPAQTHPLGAFGASILAPLARVSAPDIISGYTTETK